MRLTGFFKLYKICILLHRCNLKIFAKNRFEKSAISVKIQQKLKILNLQISQNLQNLAKSQKIQFDNLVLVDFEKCCKARIFLQRSASIEPKTSEILTKICQKFSDYPTSPDVADSRAPRQPRPWEARRRSRGKHMEQLDNRSRDLHLASRAITTCKIKFYWLILSKICGKISETGWNS